MADEGAARQPDHSQTVQRRLSKIIDLFKPRRYRLSAKGKDHANPETGDGKAAKSRSAKPVTKKAKEAEKTSRKRNVKRKDHPAADAGKPADKSLEAQNAYPKAVWISHEDGTRAKGFLEDRAAAYLPEQNLLQINRDFSVFADTIDYCGRGFVADETAQTLVRDTVYSWYEQALVESVLGMRALRNSKEWSDRDLEKALSSEGLTAAVMQRYHIIGATRDALRRTLRGLPTHKSSATPATPKKSNCQELDVAANLMPAQVLA